MMVALAGGVGGARLAVGLAAVLPPRALSIVVNTGDDFEHHGLTVCPDLDTVMYTLAGVNNRQTGWGRARESWHFMETLGALGGENWFRLGDRDLAVHVMRTAALSGGAPLSQVTRQLAERLGVRHPILPMSDSPVRTRVVTDEGELSFQDYFVRRRCRPRVRRFRFAGYRKAAAVPALRRLMRAGTVSAVVICPSNPYISIAPILAVAEIRAWIRARDFPVVGVSPIVGGAAIKGPAAKMMRELAREPSALGIVEHYRDTVDAWVIDRKDRRLLPAIEGYGKPARAIDTIMSNRARSIAVGMSVVALAREITR